ncbi:MAG TPA: NADH-dependent [FeFe] hydrogenase, group A6 [Bacteroidales bacterium]|jgi:NADP-reducing hydrogenase subunit HndD|nr:[FeFe] hydrogenase, group A [Bacteroidales bacterium]MDI9574320.1 NADH-dependent [FeFe] hydrogenase, group A6 [Bacteroidota bacterium]OQC61639.1 MAG: NADP-reducing hydrogenase subunit HndC [Bacteroidetes bacterium ADurb.Bin012]MBP9512600.1 [FeFe] hydrogenase, group A [Bacteroidales bacterium]MBP9587510.1 [FeFe] hydrogenase, group A [Bacteroidales bacterium]
MELVKLTIDKKSVEVEKGTSILNAARKVGIEIPTLCYFNLEGMNIENKPGGCRICVVEVQGRRNLAPACATEVTEGMVVKTNSTRVLNARRTVMELILSDHPFDCLVCPKSGNCELQSLAHRLGIRDIPYQGEQSTYRKDTSPSIIRDVDKCILCRRCEMMCNDIQTVGALSAINRGFMAVVAPAFEMNLEKSPCTYCGQCVAVCPTGALTEVDNTRQVISALADPTKTVIVQTAPAVRAALGEEFGLEPGSLVTGKMVSALRELGFDYVFDTDFAADLTIMEEGSELLDRLTRYLSGDRNVRLPILTSCCPAWVNFFEHNFPELKDVPSTARSPQQMFGSIAKTYFAKKLGIDRNNLVVVSIMPCLAKKYECQRSEFLTDGNPDVDFSLSTRELANFIKLANIDFNSLPESDFDRPLGESTGAAVIFGTTGGVIEAAVRTAYELYTKKPLPRVDFEELRGLEGVRAATVNFDGLELRIGIAHGLGNARQLLEEVRDGKSQYHAIEIMACPGGCIGGGGQPLHHGDASILKARQKALYEEDRNKALRKSHENPYIIQLYEEFLGQPLSEMSHHLLHTQYFDKSTQIVIE